MGKGKFISLAIALLFVSALGAWSTYKGAKGENSLLDDIESLNFEKSGVLVKNNPGMEADKWYLIYDEPGSPAATLKLKFTGKTSCQNKGTIMDCSELDLQNGLGVRIAGIKNNNEIKVEVLEINN